MNNPLKEVAVKLAMTGLCNGELSVNESMKIIEFLTSQGFVQTEPANIPEPDADMLMDLAGHDEFIAFQIYVKSIGKANPGGLLTRKVEK